MYLSDHGEMAGEHGLWWKHTWHEAAIRIPLIFQLPEHRSGDAAPCARPDVAGLIDVFPTLCGLAGIPAPDGLDGADLRVSRAGDQASAPYGAREAGEPSARLVAESFSERWGEGHEFRAAVAGRYKYVGFRAAPELLFDLVDDPLEQRNLAPRAAGDARQALEALRRAVHGGFDWDRTVEALHREARALAGRYAKRAPAKGPNQILLPDGRLIEADAHLYRPAVVSSDLGRDFDDWPGAPR